MKRLLNSNWFFVLSLAVMLCWALALFAPTTSVRLIDCPYRVSARGVIHGPDSPWWGLTSPSPCFRTSRAARIYVHGGTE